MDTEALKHYESLLKRKIESLMGRADDTVGDMSGHDEACPDPNDQASLETDRNFLLQIRERERGLIRQARQALDRIENGTYGVCESCGDEIAPARLEARPEATLCVDCKSERESRSKRRPWNG